MLMPGSFKCMAYMLSSDAYCVYFTVLRVLVWLKSEDKSVVDAGLGVVARESLFIYGANLIASITGFLATR